MSSSLRALAGAAWMTTCVLGCGGAPADPSDAGESTADAGAPDGGAPIDECRRDGECEDGDRCTTNTCIGGRCAVERVEDCSQCATDADCDDGFRCTIDSCFFGFCSSEWTSAECECNEDAHCDDFVASTIDRCVDYACVHEARTCAIDAECDDAYSCTLDRCVSGACTNESIPGCGSGCPDLDGDGHGMRWCSGGDDCDATNPAVHPGASEVCDDALDNDCDARVDFVDSDCSTGGETCASARPLVPGTPLDGAIAWDGSSGAMRMPCGASNFFTLTLTETSDVDVSVTLMEPPPPTPVPGCPECTPGGDWEYWYRIFLETTCGDTSTDLGDGGSWCRTYSSGGFLGGSGMDTVRLRRVPAGTYTIELQASDMFAWMPIAIRYTIDATVTPSAAPACGTASALSEATAVTARTGSGVNAFTADCSGGVVDAEEALHTFTLAERRRVRLEAAATPLSGGSIPGVRVGVYGACDPASTRASCLEQTGGTCHPRSTLETVLDAGTYWVTVEGASGGDIEYTLTMTTEALGAACAGAPVIAGSGSFSGTSAGGADAFRDERVCGDGYASDAVYRVEVSARSRVVLDLVASYSRAMLTLYDGCGEQRRAGGRTSTRVDLELDPGTYYAVVGGQQPGDSGSYVLNATFVPVAP